MTFFIGITTYNRCVYLKELIESLEKTRSKLHKYIVYIHDDGSTDDTQSYLKNLKNTRNISYYILESSNKGSHHAINKLLLYSKRHKYNLGFMLDDDLVFLRGGWERQYYNLYTKQGCGHMSFYDPAWTPPNISPVYTKHAQSLTSIVQSQGAFWTFTSDIIESIGYIDEHAFGRRGYAHRDFSLRACRLQNQDMLYDIRDSHLYLKLQPKQGYICTPNYSEELRKAKQDQQRKEGMLKDTSRSFIPLPDHELNYIFDHIYLLNLKRRPDRLKKVQQRLQGIQYEVVEAQDGSKFKKCKGLSINPGECGCYLSHLSIYKDAYKKGYKNILILEDDCRPHKDLISLLKHIPIKYDILYLGTGDSNIRTSIAHPMYKANRIDGTFAYAINSDILPQIIELFENPIRTPCDTLLHTIQNTQECYVMCPNLFIADVSESDLRNSRDIYQHAKKVMWDLEQYL